MIDRNVSEHAADSIWWLTGTSQQEEQFIVSKFYTNLHEKVHWINVVREEVINDKLGRVV